MLLLNQKHGYSSNRNWKKPKKMIVKNTGNGFLKKIKSTTENTPWNNEKVQDESIRADNFWTEGIAKIMHNICLQGKYFTVTKIARSVYISVKAPLILFQNTSEKNMASLRKECLNSLLRSGFLLWHTQQPWYSELSVWLGIDRTEHLKQTSCSEWY